MTYQVTVTVTVPDVEAEDADDAINFVTEEIESVFDRPVSFSNEKVVGAPNTGERGTDHE